jgi:hypothetical protein
MRFLPLSKGALRRTILCLPLLRVSVRLEDGRYISRLRHHHLPARFLLRLRLHFIRPGLHCLEIRRICRYQYRRRDSTYPSAWNRCLSYRHRAHAFQSHAAKMTSTSDLRTLAANSGPQVGTEYCRSHHSSVQRTYRAS